MYRIPTQLDMLLSRRQRRQVIVLLVALICRAGIDVVGVASIAPFMSIVAKPEIIHRHSLLLQLYKLGGFSSETSFLVGFGLAIIILLTICNSFSAVTTWAMQRFVWSTNHQLSVRLLQGYLSQPYSFFVTRNSASLHKNILSEVQNAVANVLMPALNLVAQGLVVAAIAFLLVWLNPLLAAAVVLVVGGAYGAIYCGVRNWQQRLGKVRMAANLERFKVAGEAFGGIKDVKVLQREHNFVDLFYPASKKYSNAVAVSLTIATLPRYLFETIGFGGILLILVINLRAGQNVQQILPVLSLYAFAGYRLMPALQQLFAAAIAIRFHQSALDELCRDLDEIPKAPILRSVSPEKLDFTDGICLDQVSFSYVGAQVETLRDISLKIRCNSTVGLVGPSGSGKTTLVDLLLGLYEPDRGVITIDGVPLNSTSIHAWRRQVGYVPQHIFLSDDSIAQNIAFGISAKDIDYLRVEQAARVAHLHDFIKSLPSGYDTDVGERGVRLSGGQRQRVGIARALYHDPDVLVMDEATSALDGATEDAVMEAIHELAGSKTIVLIAHRLTTVQRCDCIYLLNSGHVVDRGTYANLLNSNTSFRAMAKLPQTSSLISADRK